MQEGVEAGSCVARRGSGVPGVGLIVTFLGICQDLQSAFSPVGLSCFPGVGSDLTRVEQRFPLVRPAFPLVAVASRAGRYVVVFSGTSLKASSDVSTGPSFTVNAQVG